MDQQIDAYCERIGPAFWAEPVNALTNLAFLVAAIIMWRRLGPGAPGILRLLCVILGVIGIGSFLFHTFATAWASAADVLPILGYILVYIYAVNRMVWDMGRMPSALLTAGFIPYAALTVPIYARLDWLGSSAGYVPVPVLILIYAVLLRRRTPATARGLVIGVAILTLSLTFRTLDEPLCDALPLGTHFLWHILNAIMLGWMIEVLRRHALAGGTARR